ncbi:MAG TPA: tetratricopeptide repeat protein [Pyrinomonadaceae bacterium]|jgi:tetratricopeptide (TPR) repeat protein
MMHLLKSAIRNQHSAILIALLLLVLTLAAYQSVRKYEFVAYDDDRYVTANTRIQEGLSWKNAAWALTSLEVANWHPLTWLSHMTDCQLYALHPSGHHLTNLLLHLFNVLLLYRVLQLMTRAVWPSAVVAALFAVHPLNVESVAWVAERKNLLSTLFWLLTMWAYVAYVRRKGWHRYLLVLGAFVLGLMSKPMLVTLPCVLLLLDYWPLGRFQGRAVEGRADHQSLAETSQPHAQAERRLTGLSRRRALRLLLEKAPLFLLSAASSVITVKAQRMDGAFDAKVLPLGVRLSNALVSYLSYIYKMVWPTRLAVLYPHPGDKLPLWHALIASIVLISLTLLVIRARKKYPYLLTGWLWYLGTLVPVIGIVQVGGQSMADRYAYVPLIGLFIIIAWGTADLTRSLRFRIYWLAAASALVLIALMMTTWRQLSHWQNSVTLFEQAIKMTDDNAIAHNNLGAVLVRNGRLDEGLAHLNEAVRIYPNYGTAYDNIAVTLYQQGNIMMRDESRWPEAIALYRRALELKPNLTEAQQSLDQLLEKIQEKER